MRCRVNPDEWTWIWFQHLSADSAELMIDLIIVTYSVNEWMDEIGYSLM